MTPQPQSPHLARRFKVAADYAAGLFAALLGRGVLALDLPPVLKLYSPDGPYTWLIGALAPEDPDVALALVDLGQGTPEIRTVRLSRILDMCGPIGLPIERDTTFLPKQSLADYAREARAAGRITA